MYPARIRALGVIALAAASVLAAVACSSGGGSSSASSASSAPAEYKTLYQGALKEGGTVVVYSNVSAEALDKITAKFDSLFPGMHLEAQFFSTVPMETRITAEAKSGQPKSDVIMNGDVGYLSNMISTGQLAQMTNVPNVTAISSDYRDGLYYYASEIYLSAITYNTNNVSTPPTSYQDVVNMGKKAAIVDPRTGGGSALITYMLTKLYGTSFWSSVKSNGNLMFASVAQAAPEVASGALNAMINSNGAGTCDEEQGQPVKVVYPAQGVVALPFFTAVQAKAQHPDGARLYAAWIASQQGQTLLTGADCTFSARPDVSASSTLPALSSLHVLKYPYAQYSAQYPALDKQAIAAAGLTTSS
jgi:iron(III) transport system substrate-binding protein